MFRGQFSRCVISTLVSGRRYGSSDSRTRSSYASVPNGLQKRTLIRGLDEISDRRVWRAASSRTQPGRSKTKHSTPAFEAADARLRAELGRALPRSSTARSEEHTSELQSR